MIAKASHSIRWVLMILVRTYQVTISPLFAGQCRFVPSCSDYALEALQRKPLLEGLWLTVRRVGRCHPMCRGGFDPVPPDRGGRTAPAKAAADD